MAVAFSPSSTVTACALRGGASLLGSCFLVLRSRGAGRLQSAVTTRRSRTWCAVIVGSTAVPEASAEEGRHGRRSSEQLALPPELVDELVEEALVWCSQHGLIVGDKNHPVKSHY